MPTSDPKTEYMRINGGTDKLGEWNKGKGPIKMLLGEKRRWLTGWDIIPWELPDLMYRNDEMPERLVYKYTIWRD